MSLQTLLPTPRINHKPHTVQYNNQQKQQIQTQHEQNIHQKPYIAASTHNNSHTHANKQSNGQSRQQDNMQIPPYPRSKTFIPPQIHDGGAFPEYKQTQDRFNHLQHKQQHNSLTLNSSSTQDGTDVNSQLTQYQPASRTQQIAEKGHKKGRIVHAEYNALVPTGYKDIQQRPAQDSKLILQTQEKTRKALEKIIDAKIAASNPKNINEEESAPEFVRYTSNEGNSRIIKMYEAPVDPLEPPRHKHKKVPRGPGSPPAPVLHSPPRKITAQDQKEWTIPPCVSNWKNKKGYAIALDKRLAADGRGLIDHTINDKFATLADSLYTADRFARQETEQRQRVERAVAAKEREQQEEKIRLLAQKAREERAGMRNAEDTEDGYKEREEIRRDRERERQRDLRKSHMGSEAKAKMLSRGEDRDVSEKIALGMATAQSKETMYDQRLFNKDAGIGTGFKDDEAYSLYDKPLFNHAAAASIYRPKVAIAEDGEEGSGDLDKIMSGGAKFTGAGGHLDNGAGNESTTRDGPVQFQAAEEDPFGIDQFLTSTLNAGPPKPQNERRGGGMISAAGKTEDYQGGPSRRHMQFESESSNKRARQ